MRLISNTNFKSKSHNAQMTNIQFTNIQFTNIQFTNYTESTFLFKTNTKQKGQVRIM